MIIQIKQNEIKKNFIQDGLIHIFYYQNKKVFDS